MWCRYLEGLGGIRTVLRSMRHNVWIGVWASRPNRVGFGTGDEVMCSHAATTTSTTAG